ncbi:hypothetical protein F5Y15DRAFT_199336 [Xylariaceae sp. FL0016]|nr:hypothetical protein F5Y15DRAFT_199336 [Xylariaceae sp. FL0016]
MSTKRLEFSMFSSVLVAARQEVVLWAAMGKETRAKVEQCEISMCSHARLPVSSSHRVVGCPRPHGPVRSGLTHTNKMVDWFSCEPIPSVHIADVPKGFVQGSAQNPHYLGMECSKRGGWVLEGHIFSAHSITDQPRIPG